MPDACVLTFHVSLLEPNPLYNPAAGPHREDRPGDSSEHPLNEALVEFMGDSDELMPDGKQWSFDAKCAKQAQSSRFAPRQTFQ
jgi:hypothetical protein